MALVKVPFVNLGLQYQSLKTPILEAFDRISSNGSYILSKDVDTFEDNFAQYCGVKHAVSLGNGGDALFLGLKALGVGPGDEVITAANSFVASAWAIANLGAKPVYVDVTDDYNIDVSALEKAITPKTRALMPVHLTGRVANMDAILKIAQQHRLTVVEDAAQAVGASYKNIRAGAFGNVGCFSLHPLKNLHVHGDGGMLTTNDSKIAEQIKLLRNHGLKNRDECVIWGHNTRLDSIQAAIADIKLKYLDSWNDRHRSIAKRYSESFSRFVAAPTDGPHEKSVYHRYIIATPLRDSLMAYLAEREIETKVNYPIPLHLQVASRELGYKKGDFPVAERLADTIVSLPVYNEMTDDQVTHVIDSVCKFFTEKS